MLIFCQKRPFSKKHTALMPIFCKKRSILSKTQCSHVIFSKFSWKTPAVMPILDQKTSILSKLQYYMGQKVNRMPFFFDFSWKNDFSHAHILSKKLQFAKKTHCSHAHILSEKRLFSQKNGAPMLFFSNISLKALCCHAQICSKERQFCQNYTILWAKKINRKLLFSDFSPKNHSSHAHFLSKNVHSLKNTMLSCPYFVQKTYILSKSQCSSVIFYNFFHENPPRCHAHIWSKKTSILSTLHYIMGQNSH